MSLFVFGYGSLLYKPVPHYVNCYPGFIKGFARRFAQSSSDHRGTVENPGRVCTIVHSDEWAMYAASHPCGKGDAFPEDDQVWGVVYEIAPEHSSEIKAYLDDREKNGYTEERIHVYGADNKVAFENVLIYVGRLDNPAFVGPQPIDELAMLIATHEGPSGTNKDYLYQLAEHVRRICPESTDHYLETLLAHVKHFEKAGHVPPSEQNS
ncbi:hypothetical protein E3P92_03107 [Wallemia ichthyophaga]|nr:hypothetical protein E3P91_02778 [Wallemia ichthyophaga]TIA80190.1 hypothetical protein E3P98_02836 [Wallemia ichthyophaga]TIA89384.1 hypothetical protein E3P97_03054 [Wallemia ichthyophaga]TIA97638.1 hypothetical protein E3P95_02768 [Wallemia ichthyophaga]TIA98766.1 hypothetical protein E3P94_02813 [Wallemia ichthyophaga]